MGDILSSCMSAAEDQMGQDYGVDSIGPAIKAALSEAGEYAESLCAGEGKFLDNPDIRIPLPDELTKMRDVLAKVGLAEKLDDLETAMNKAAEIACNGCAAIFKGVIENMDPGDALALIQSDNPRSCTDFLKENSEEQLKELMTPPVQDGLSQVSAVELWNQVKDGYDSVRNKATGGMMGMLSKATGVDIPEINWDLEPYVVGKGTDAIFGFIATKESDFRENPLGSASELVQGVFKKFSAQSQG